MHLHVRRGGTGLVMDRRRWFVACRGGGWRAGGPREEEIVDPPSLKRCSDGLKEKESKQSDGSYKDQTLICTYLLDISIKLINLQCCNRPLNFCFGHVSSNNALDAIS